MAASTTAPYIMSRLAQH